MLTIRPDPLRAFWEVKVPVDEWDGPHSLLPHDGEVIIHPGNLYDCLHWVRVTLGQSYASLA
jgi:hypothetical protein